MQSHLEAQNLYSTQSIHLFDIFAGKDYNLNKKHQYELKKEIMNQATRFQIKSRNKGPSKKLDCPVLFAVRKMYFFPEYPLETDTKRNRGNIAAKIRARLAKIKKETCNCEKKGEIESEQQTSSVSSSTRTGRPLPGKLEFLTRLPGTSAHNHDVSKAANFMKLQLKKLGSKGVEMMQLKKPVCLLNFNNTRGIFQKCLFLTSKKIVCEKSDLTLKRVSFLTINNEYSRNLPIYQI